MTRKTKSSVIALFMSAMAISTAHADSLQIHTASIHSGQSSYNEQNFGLAYRYQKSEDVSYQLGYYVNSYYNDTFYASVNYTPFHYENVSVGAFGGVGTGYELPIMAGFMAKVEFEDFNITVRAVPKVSAGTDSVVAIEFGIKF